MYICRLNILGAGDAAGMYCMLCVTNNLVDFKRSKNENFCILFYKSLKFSSVDTLRRTHPMNNSRSKKKMDKIEKKYGCSCGHCQTVSRFN